MLLPCIIGDHMYVSTYCWKKLVKRIKESRLYCMHLLSKILNKSLTSFFHKMAVYSGLVVIKVYIFYQIYLVIYHKGCHVGAISVVKKANLS